MKATLKFNLPEDEVEYKNAVKSSNMYTALWEIDQWLRSQLKYNDSLTQEEYDTYQKTREEFYRIINQNEITL